MGARWLYMLPALILSVLAVILALVGLSREPTPTPDATPAGIVMQVTEQEREDPLQHQYWLATRELGIGAQVQEGDFRQVGVSIPLAEAIPADEAVAGKVLRRNVRAGEILARSHMQPANALARRVPAGYRAMAIPIDQVTAIGGFLKPGDLVDVLTHFKSAPDTRQATAMVVLSSIEVLAVEGRLEESLTPEQQEQQQRTRNATAVLAIPREDLPRLMLAEANGSLRLALAGDGKGGVDEGLAPDEEGTSEAPRTAMTAQEREALLKASALTRYEDLFPSKPAPAPSRPAAPRGDRVEVFEGSTSRSTYVH